jgi:hypothetical protein
MKKIVAVMMKRAFFFSRARNSGFSSRAYQFTGDFWSDMGAEVRDLH